MGRVIVATTGSGTPTAGADTFFGMGNSAASSFITPEAAAAYPLADPGLFSALQVSVDSVGTSRAIALRRNGADTALAVSPANGASGAFDAASVEVGYAVGDTVDLRAFWATGNCTLRYARAIFTGANHHVGLFFAGPLNSAAAANVTRFFQIAGEGGVVLTTEADAQFRVRAPGSVRNAVVNVTSNARTSDTTIRSRVNGANGSILITIPAGMTGPYSDTVNSDALVSGDLFSWACIKGAGSGGVLFNTACSIRYTTNVNDIAAQALAGRARARSATASFFAPTGRLGLTTATESEAAITHGFPVRASNLRAFISANTYDGNSVFTLRAAGADATQTFTVPAGSTGWFEDTTRSDDLAAAAAVAVRVTDAATTGSMTICSIGMTERDLQEGVADLKGRATEASAAVATSSGVASLQGSGKGAFGATSFIFGRASLVGVGRFFVAARFRGRPSAALRGRGVMTPFAMRQGAGQAVFTASGRLESAANFAAGGRASLKGSGGGSALMVTVVKGVAALKASARTVLSAGVVTPGVALFRGMSGGQANLGFTFDGEASLTGRSGGTVTGQRAAVAAAALVGAAVIAGRAFMGRRGVTGTARSMRDSDA